MWIKGHYGTRHPKDVAAKKAKELREFIKERQCSKTEMWEPTEYNVQKHIREQKTTTKAAKELKKVVKQLDQEDHRWGNTENFRPRR